MSIDPLQDSPLGKNSIYVSEYDPSQLCPLPRTSVWQDYGYEKAPWTGTDIWNAWEISWLNGKGLPQLAIGEFQVPADTVNLIESKSLKLYLNSFSQSSFESSDAVKQRITYDLSACAQGDVGVVLHNVDDSALLHEKLPGTCIDKNDVEIEHYTRNAELLNVNTTKNTGETLYSHLLKSNCPVTGQPDWGSVIIKYNGQAIDHDGLLKYIVSLREECDFHEKCTETIFLDIMQRCQPDELTVYTRYLRRGGLDINPWRSNVNETPLNTRLSRQ